MSEVVYPDRTTRIERFDRSIAPASLFSTHALPANERFDAWRESMNVFLSSSLNSDREIDSFVGEIESYLIDDVMLSRGIASRQKYDRPIPKIAADGLDHYMIQVFLEGGCTLRMRNRDVQSLPGQAIAFDLGEVMDSFNTSFDVLCVVVPRARLAPLLSAPDNIQGCIPDPEGGAGKMLADFISSLYLVAPKLNNDEAQGAVRALLEMIAAAYNRTTTQDILAGANGQKALLLNAQAFIPQNIADDLTPAQIAHGIGVSRTSLYRLFEPIGGVASYVRDQRLRRCLADLISMRHAGLHVSEIAYKWGFSDASHFTRIFRQRFGHTPSEVRPASSSLVRRDITALDPRVGDRRYEEWITALA